MLTLVSSCMEVVAYSGTTSGVPGTFGAYTEINWANNVGPVLAIQPGYGVPGNTYKRHHQLDAIRCAIKSYTHKKGDG